MLLRILTHKKHKSRDPSMLMNLNCELSRL